MATTKARGLGRGLHSLFEDIDFNPEAVSVREVEGAERNSSAAVFSAGGESVVFVHPDEIKPNSKQPRKFFDEEALEDLTNSIKEHGIIQPILLRPSGKGYEIVAGERRYRAARKAGLKAIPAIIRDLDEKQNMLYALIENMQREDLNVMEEAQGLREMSKIYNLTQEEMAISIGKSRPYISNTMRLLKLPQEVQDLVLANKLTAGHARAIAGMESRKLQVEAASKAVKNGWSVRETEKYTGKKAKSIKPSKELSPDIKQLEESLCQVFGTKVKLSDAENKGKIEIEYYSREELDRILELLLSKK
ncbi:MAG: ParB/RepB/Spo0J family partition protein [Clostridia bacterium]|nr:ParB/RepB/Spo0J family partition protein [Clostridia bacterium]